MNFRHTPDLPLAVGELHASAHNLFNLTHKVVEAASYSHQNVLWSCVPKLACWEGCDGGLSLCPPESGENQELAVADRRNQPDDKRFQSC